MNDGSESDQEGQMEGWARLEKRGKGRTQGARDRDGKDEDEGIVIKSWTWEF